MRVTTIASQIQAHFSKVLSIVAWTFAAVALSGAVVTVYVLSVQEISATAPGAFLRAFAPPLGVLMLVQVGLAMMAKSLLARGRHRLAAWIFLLVSLVSTVTLNYFLPEIAPLLGVMLMASLMLVIPHIQRGDLAAMQLIVIAMLTRLWVFAFPVPTGDLPQMVARTTGMIIGVISFVYVFGSMFFGLSRALREIDVERERLEQRHRYLQALQDTSASLVQRMEMNHLLNAILFRATALADAEHACVSLLTESGQELKQLVGIGLFVDEELAGPPNSRPGEGLVGAVWSTCKTMVVKDYRSWPGAIAIPNDPVRAIMGVPLLRNGEFAGVITLAHTDPEKQFSPDQIAVIEQLAELGSVAVENARLYELSRSHEALLEQRISERTRELSAMLNIANATNASFDTVRVFDALFEELRALIGISSGTLLVASGPEHVRVAHYAGPAVSRIKVGRLFAMGPHQTQVFSWRKPMIISDVRSTDDALALSYRNYVQANIQEQLPAHIAAWMGVPVINNDHVIGMLSLTHDQIGGFTDAHAALALAAATQGAMAIVNNQLHARTVEAATLAERSRLARDLHDSVSQAVFSMVLNAKTMEQLALIDPNRVLEPLPHVISLAESALTEMRALIFELQPESLQREGLVSALQKQIAATRARHHLTIEEQLCAQEPDAGPQVKESLYRIAVEALHNAVKHSRAKLVRVRLEDSGDRIELQISDDGIGFDTRAVPYGHFGLNAMRERVAQLNGAIDIDSAPGHGTRIAVSVHKTFERERV